LIRRKHAPSEKRGPSSVKEKEGADPVRGGEVTQRDGQGSSLKIMNTAKEVRHLYKSKERERHEQGRLFGGGDVLGCVGN